ncbi:hypothetical protein AVEN_182908-1 [Araneus ventricosus]|uniref:Uncharacterized protein n=1 Tax=Araneus ventricosus TaxID=182803 RepID=A0A4Y2L6R5_ARAVE|nr:hypothetical protein AVEN_182908-1 [Araneus ventricosus]
MSRTSISRRVSSTFYDSRWISAMVLLSFSSDALSLLKRAFHLKKPFTTDGSIAVNLLQHVLRLCGRFTEFHKKSHNRSFLIFGTANVATHVVTKAQTT